LLVLKPSIHVLLSVVIATSVDEVAIASTSICKPGSDKPIQTGINSYVLVQQYNALFTKFQLSIIHNSLLGWTCADTSSHWYTACYDT